MGEGSGPSRHGETRLERVCVAWCLLPPCRGIAALLALRGQAVGADRVSLGLGVPGVASPGRSIRGQACFIISLFVSLTGCMWHSSGVTCLLSLHLGWRVLIFIVCLAEMTLLSSQTPSLETSSAATESPEQRMLEKRSKVIEELLQTERDYIRDLEMCVERIMVPLQQAQVGDGRTGYGAALVQ